VQDLWTQLKYFAPELTLTAVILLVIVGDLFLRKTRRELVLSLGLVGLLGTLFATYLVADGASHPLFSGMVVRP
jgi:NADH:ubiquinone oxidoreductase subunit 2 (subunit N)